MDLVINEDLNTFLEERNWMKHDSGWNSEGVFQAEYKLIQTAHPKETWAYEKSIYIENYSSYKINPIAFYPNPCAQNIGSLLLVPV